MDELFCRTIPGNRNLPWHATAKPLSLLAGAGLQAPETGSGIQVRSGTW